MPGEKRKLSKNKLSEPESKRQEIDDEEQSLRLHFSNLSSTENPKVESLLSISDLKVSRKLHTRIIWIDSVGIWN